MKTTQIDTQSVSNQIINEITKEILPSFDHLEAESEQMFQQILEDTQLSESEHALIHQLINGENTPDDALAILDQLIASCDDTHPYISYYHFIKGMAIEVLLDEVYYEKTLTKEEFETEINKIVVEMNESIRLNDSFGGAYYLRGIAHGLLGNQEAGTEDFLNAINLKCQDAIDYIEKLMP